MAELPSLGIPFPELLLGTGLVLLVWLGLASLFVYATNREHKRVTGRHWLSRLIYFVYLLLIAILAVTAFGSIVQFGHLDGYALMAHTAAAGAFVFLMVAIAFLYLPTEVDATDIRNVRIPSWWGSRGSAWALVVSSIAAAATMLLSMLPILDTPGLLVMATLHRYAGLAVVVSAILHVFSLTCVRLGWR